MDFNPPISEIKESWDKIYKNGEKKMKLRLNKVAETL